jgi:hypothetical protein
MIGGTAGQKSLDLIFAVISPHLAGWPDGLTNFT